MGRPIKPSFVGKPTDYSDDRKVIVFDSAWIEGAEAISTKPVYIIKQTGAARYLVSDGENTGEVYLTDSISEEGQGIIKVTVDTNIYPVSKLTMHRVDTFNNGSFAWTFYEDNIVTSMTGTEYTEALTPVVPPEPAAPKQKVDPDTLVQEGEDGTISIPVKD